MAVAMRNPTESTATFWQIIMFTMSDQMGWQRAVFNPTAGNILVSFR